MLRKTALRLASAMAVAAGLAGPGGTPAAACNRIDGCNWETINQNRDMMASGRMNDAMRAGQDNIAAFHDLVRREQEYRAWQQGAAPARR